MKHTIACEGWYYDGDGKIMMPQGEVAVEFAGFSGRYKLVEVEFAQHWDDPTPPHYGGGRRCELREIARCGNDIALDRGHFRIIEQNAKGAIIVEQTEKFTVSSTDKCFVFLSLPLYDFSFHYLQGIEIVKEVQTATTREMICILSQQEYIALALCNARRDILIYFANDGGRQLVFKEGAAWYAGSLTGGMESQGYFYPGYEVVEGTVRMCKNTTDLSLKKFAPDFSSNYKELSQGEKISDYRGRVYR